MMTPKKIAGFTNIELISDRPTEVNLKEIYEVKKWYQPHKSLMLDGWVDAKKNRLNLVISTVEYNSFSFI